MLGEVGEPLDPGGVVPGPDVVGDGDGHERPTVHGRHRDPEAVLEGLLNQGWGVVLRSLGVPARHAGIDGNRGQNERRREPDGNLGPNAVDPPTAGTVGVLPTSHRNLGDIAVGGP
jgi:hypothetical protein